MEARTWLADTEKLKDSGILTIHTLQNADESCNLVNNTYSSSFSQLYFQMKLLSPRSGQMRRSSVLVWKTLAASSRWTCFLVACPQADGKIRSKGLKIVCKDVNEAYFPRYHIDYFLLHDLNWFDPTWMCWIPRDNYDIPIPFDTIIVKLYLFQSNHIIAHLLIYSLQIFIVILFKKHEFARSCFIQSVWKAKLRELQQANTELADLEEDSFKRRVGCVAIVFLERSSCVLLPASTHLHLLLELWWLVVLKSLNLMSYSKHH